MGSCLSAEPPPPPLLGTVQISARPLLCCCPRLWATWEGFVLCAYPQCPFFSGKRLQNVPLTLNFRRVVSTQTSEGVRLWLPRLHISEEPLETREFAASRVWSLWSYSGILNAFLLGNKWDGENRGVIIRIRSPYKDPLGIWNFKGSLYVFVWTRASE